MLALEHADAFVERTGCSGDHNRELRNRASAGLWVRARSTSSGCASYGCVW